MFSKTIVPALLAVALVATAASMHADTIPGLQDTGVGTPGNPDSVWQITLDPSGGTVPRPATIITPHTDTSPYNWYAGAPVGDGANWIGANSSANINPPGVPDGDYQYKLQFDLTGYNPLTASFVYESAADNLVLSATLNGTGIPYDSRTPGGGNQYQTLSEPISVTGPFVSGINTLTFDVKNTTSNPSPSGFLFVVESSTVSTPEPATLTLLLSALLGLGFVYLRRRGAKA